MAQSGVRICSFLELKQKRPNKCSLSDSYSKAGTQQQTLGEANVNMREARDKHVHTET